MVLLPMPKQSRGFWACGFCNLKFDTYEEVICHEQTECSQAIEAHRRRVPISTTAVCVPAKQGNMPPLSYSEQHQLDGSFDFGYRPNPNRQRGLPLMLANENSMLSEADILACQSLELFEMGEHDLDISEQQEMGQVGLRCVYCAGKTSTSDRYDFPRDIMHVGSSVRRIADSHLVRCPAVPTHVASAQHVRRQMQERRQGLSHEAENQRRLMEFCTHRCQQLGLMNNFPEGAGIAFAEQQQPQQQADADPGLRYQGTLPAPQARDEAMLMSSPGRRSSPGLAPTYEATFGPALAFGESEASGTSAQQHTGMYHHPYPLDRRPTAALPAPVAAEAPSSSAMSRYEARPIFHAFPFFQDTNTGDWVCRFCHHIPPHFKEQNHNWPGTNKSPPPPDFINYHLSLCREYNRARIYAPGSGAGPPEMQQTTLQPEFSPARSSSYLTSRREPSSPAADFRSRQHWESSLNRRMGPHPPPLQLPPGPIIHGPSGGGVTGSSLPGGSRASSYPSPARSDMPPLHVVERAPRYPDLPQAKQPPISPRSSSVGTGDEISKTRAINFLIANDKSNYDADGVPIPADSRLVLEEDKLLLTDYFYYLMKQLRLVRFSEADRRTRGGKREKIQVGYGGLQCVHCADAQNARKFFWSNVDRLANSFAEIPGHVLKCRRCPKPTKDALLRLKQSHPEQMARLPRGSQKVFFRRMWRRLHDEDPIPQEAQMPPPGDTCPVADTPQSSLKIEQGETATSAASAAHEKQSLSRFGDRKPAAIDTKPSASENSHDGTSGSDESAVMFERPTVAAAKMLADSTAMSGPPSPSSRVLLAIPDDKQWLSDTDCFIRRQIEVFCATIDDVEIARADRKYPVHEGQIGIRCIHCAMSKTGEGAKGQGVAYPFAISGIYESVREFQRLHLDSCEHVPPAVSSKLAGLKGSASLSSVLRRYYILAAKALGLYDTREGVRAGGQCIPLRSQAAFAFSEEKMASPELNLPSSPATLGPPTPPGRGTGVHPHVGYGFGAAVLSRSSSPIPFASNRGFAEGIALENPKKRQAQSQSPDSRKSARSNVSGPK